MKPVRLILDASAIAQYTRTTGVGETIREVHTDNVTFAVPVLCLVEATQTTDLGTVELLTRHPACVLLDVPHDHWRSWAAIRSVVAGPDAAAAVWFAYAYDCDVESASQFSRE